jgi:hypothetical protein
MIVILNVNPDVPTVNGYIYSKEIIEKEIILKELLVYLGIGQGGLNDLKDLIGFANSKLNEKNEIISNIKLIDTEISNIFKQTDYTDFDYTIKGYGELSEDNNVFDFKCISINIVDREKEDCE